MEKSLYIKLFNVLKYEFDCIIKNDELNDKEKIKKIDDILHLLKILSNFDELEPIIADYFNKKAKKNKFEKER